MPETRADIFSPSSVPYVSVQQHKLPKADPAMEGLETLQDSKQLNECLVKGSLGSCGGSTAGHSTLLGNAISPHSHCQQRFRPQGFRLSHRPYRFVSQPQHSRAAGSLCALAFPAYAPASLSKHTQAGVPGDIKLLLCSALEGLKPTTGSCLLHFP